MTGLGKSTCKSFNRKPTAAKAKVKLVFLWVALAAAAI
jgi:hypothetical protein